MIIHYSNILGIKADSHFSIKSIIFPDWYF
jgi:hypothetical protein